MCRVPPVGGTAAVSRGLVAQTADDKATQRPITDRRHQFRWQLWSRCWAGLVHLRISKPSLCSTPGKRRNCHR